MKRFHCPRFDEVQPERAVLIGPAVVVIRRGVGWHDRGQVRGSGLGGQPLGRANIGRAIHADLARRSGQFRGPLDAVIAIVAIMAKLREGAT